MEIAKRMLLCTVVGQEGVKWIVIECGVLGLSWGVWDEPLFSLHPNIILGADVLNMEEPYSSDDIDDA
ncbi:hypothetical protein CASFOL_014400 [Castilleja foliolosa]|uniref:Uncharacterized protein n=1 Tax=Castilleja foliolosa TaxID=1961234 RepID=A0ABD3DRW8_9LAMI